MTNYITQTIEPWMPQGALKAKSDYAKIAADFNWHTIPLERYNDKRFDDVVRQKKIHSWLSKIKPGDHVIHQFPTYMSADFEHMFLKTLKETNVHTTILIHDIEPLRLIKNDPWELGVLNSYDTLIVHSQAMYDELVHLGIHTSAIIQPFFDYLGSVTENAYFSHKINFAGTFQKSPWLKDYAGPQISLFGSKPKKWAGVEFPGSVDYCGNFDPVNILNGFHDGFGLLWDSDFEDKTYQTYTKFNAPHKASLYLRAGLPLIAWHKSAIGHLIKEYNIGFVIDSLDQIEEVFEVSQVKYATWQKNITPLAEQLQNGYFTQQTLQKLEKL
ncbi:sugar transferase [Leuconostoc litchii]|uniref:Beta-1,6-galactofuranosyltransferase n=1 Tax=Leuconostoc litchii TaxID=1981069 RepID=A0A6P2CN53_9LACO|nr:sugar transferase [Leuconostoc litchii]TYC47478.1 beta-1,6-galactofuranosyltransferase [Leuconostoc litchii]